MDRLGYCFSALRVGPFQSPELPSPHASHDSRLRGATLATHIILLQFSSASPGLTLLRARTRSSRAAKSRAKEMTSVASARCYGLLLPPSFAGARCCSRPSSSLRLRQRWGLRRPRTPLACVAPPDSAEPQTVRFLSTPKTHLPQVISLHTK